MDVSETERMREIFRKVHQIEIKTSRLVTEAFSGAYHSVFKGRGMDFDEVREYVHGDEVRLIDWNVTARANRPFIKKFTEERELNLVIVLDVSASEDFGSASLSKREIAAELAGVLAFSAGSNQDKVGLALMTDGIEKFIPPQKGRGHILRLVREALFYRPQHKTTNCAAALDHINRILRRRSMIFLISDFLFTDLEATARSLTLAARKHDVVAMDLHDPCEREIPPSGILWIEDAESGELCELEIANVEQARHFAKTQSEHEEKIAQMCARAGVDHLSINTVDSYVPVLQNFFQTRFARQRTS